MEFEFVSELPSKKRGFWQFDFIPTLAILRQTHLQENEKPYYTDGKYITLGIKWLFWAISFTIYK